MANRVETRPEGRARRLGPRDRGLEMDVAAFEAADFEPGHRYDLVDGRLEVSPEPNLSHDRPLRALDALLAEYSAQHAGTFDYVTPRARVYPAPETGKHSVGPDLAVFRGLRPGQEQHWRDLEPILVVEALSPGDPKKDLVRNRRMYAEVASIREYWILDPRRGSDRMTLLVLQRNDAGSEWSERLVTARGAYETRLLPGLVVDLAQPDLGLARLVAARLERVRDEGRQEGRRAATVELLTRLLVASFGPLPPAARDRLEAATLAELDVWVDRYPDAVSLGDLFDAS